MLFVANEFIYPANNRLAGADNMASVGNACSGLPLTLTIL